MEMRRIEAHFSILDTESTFDFDSSIYLGNNNDVLDLADCSL